MQITIDTDKDSLPHVIEFLTSLKQSRIFDISSDFSQLPPPGTFTATHTGTGPSPDTLPEGPGTNGLLLDSAGENWNPEVHTANQSKNSDGTWRRKRTPRSETSAVPKVPASTPTPPAPPTAQTVELGPTVMPAPVATPAVVAAPVPPAPPSSSSDQSVTTFAGLVKLATTLVGTKKLTTGQLLEACIECGVPDIHACSLPQNLAVIPAVATAINARVKA